MDRRDFLKLAGTGFFSLYYGPLFYYLPYVQRGDSNSGKIAITVDDGWYSDKVEKMLVALNGTPASFFIVGTLLDAEPELYRGILDLKYRIYNHTWSHQDLNSKDVNVRDQISWWETAYENLDHGPLIRKALRFPGLSGVNNTGIFRTAASLGYEASFGCTWGSRGVFGDPKDSILTSLEPYLISGAILLFHFVDDDIDAMPYVLDAIKKKNLTPVGLHHLPGVPIYEKPDSKKHGNLNLPR